MGEKIRLEDIPAYAKLRQGKTVSVYAMKKDLPYYRGEKVSGSLVIGKQAEDPGKMIPNDNYDHYCGPDALANRERDEKKKKEQEEKEKKEGEERQRKIREERQERERCLGWTYITMKRRWEAVTCYPIDGYLAERFFEESGMGPILSDVLGSERAFWMRLSAAVYAGEGHQFLGTSGLNAYPMKDHMVFEMNRRFALRMWGMVTQEEVSDILTRWIGLKKPEQISAGPVRSRLHLYYSEYTDRYMEDRFFSEMVRRGTQHDENYVVYRDGDFGQLLAYEPVQYGGETFDIKKVQEIATLQNSRFPSLRKASSFCYFRYPYLLQAAKAAEEIPVTLCMDPSEYDDPKQMKKLLERLEEMEEEDGRKVLRFDGEFEGIAGHFALLEIPAKRKWMTEQARDLLNKQKKRLEAMRLYTAKADPMAHYYEFEAEHNEEFFYSGNAPFTVRLKKGATAVFRQDAGRFLWFTMGEMPPDEDLVKEEWIGEDVDYMSQAFINQGETADLTEEFFNAMTGRDFTLFLSQMYREWVYSHIRELLTEQFDVEHFLGAVQRWSCEITVHGMVHSKPFDDKTAKLMEPFGVTQKDLTEYVRTCAQNPKYFSDEYADR